MGVDRKKEPIKLKALQVVLAKLEAVLLEHNHIADAGVVGIKFRMAPAYMRLEDESVGKVSEQDTERFIQDQVAKHERLVGGIMFVDEVSRLASGKIQRIVLRPWAKQDAEAMGNTRAKL